MASEPPQKPKPLVGGAWGLIFGGGYRSRTDDLLHAMQAL